MKKMIGTLCDFFEKFDFQGCYSDFDNHFSCFSEFVFDLDVTSSSDWEPKYKTVNATEYVDFDEKTVSFNISRCDDENNCSDDCFAKCSEDDFVEFLNDCLEKNGFDDDVFDLDKISAKVENSSIIISFENGNKIVITKDFVITAYYEEERVAV